MRSLRGYEKGELDFLSTFSYFLSDLRDSVVIYATTSFRLKTYIQTEYIETIMQSFITQIKDNLLSIIGLLIAIIALLHSSWRSEATERNFNQRAAGFELLKNLGELQVAVNYAYYESNDSLGNPMMGWGRIALISDLSQLLPQPVPDKASKLVAVWKENWSKLKTDEDSVSQISEEITASRLAVLETLKHLN
jgi:hypothetical protein